MSEEAGRTMGWKSALAIARSAGGEWLAGCIKETCNCGGCWLCWYRFLEQQALVSAVADEMTAQGFKVSNVLAERREMLELLRESLSTFGVHGLTDEIEWRERVRALLEKEKR